MTSVPRLQRSIPIVNKDGVPVAAFHQWWDKLADAAETTTASGVSSFNTRTGAVSLLSGDVTGALGYTPLAGNQAITLSGDASGTGTTAITVTIPTFTSSAKGLTPASGGGTTLFLRADGTWAAPTGGSGTVTNVSVVTANGVSGSVATATTTPAITLTLGAITPSSVATTGSIGYSTGAGGTVSQGTSRSTGVVLNKLCGEITLFSSTMTAGQTQVFDVTNSEFAATDSVIVNQKNSTSGAYFYSVVNKRAGVFSIIIYAPAAVAVAQSPVISFAILKSVNA